MMQTVFLPWATAAAAVLASVPEASALSRATCAASLQDPSSTLFDPGVRGQWKESLYGMKDGLPGLSVRAIEHGPDGKLMVATGAGLVTFDGIQFRFPNHRYVTLDPHAINATALPDKSLDASTDTDSVVALLHQSGRGMWAGTNSGQLRCYVGAECQIIHSGSALSWIGPLVEASDNAIWAGGGGLIRATPGSVDIIFDCREADCPFVTGLSCDPTPNGEPGSVWISTVKGLLHWDKERGVTKIDTSTTHGVFFDQAGRQWRLAADAIEVGDQSIPWNVASRSRALFESIQVDSNRTLVVLEGETLLCDYQDGDIQVSRVAEPGSALSMALGPHDSLWMGTPSEGLRFVERAPFAHLSDLDAKSILFTVKPTPDDAVVIASFTKHGLWVARPSRSDLAGTTLDLIGEGKEWEPSVPPGILDAAMDSERTGWLATEAGTLRFEDGKLTRVGSDDPLDHKKGRLCLTASGSLWTRNQGRLVELKNGVRTGPCIRLARLSTDLSRR